MRAAVQHREIRMMACMSLDGYIAPRDRSAPNQEDRGGWTSAEDKREFWKEIRDADVVIGGRRALDQMPATGKPVALVSRNSEEALLSAVNSEVQWVVDPYPSDVHDFLMRMGGKRYLLCGGSMTYDFFLRWNLVDHLILVVEPIMLGGGIRLRTPGKTMEGMDKCKFSLVSVKPLNTRGTLRVDLRRAKVW